MGPSVADTVTINFFGWRFNHEAFAIGGLMRKCFSSKIK
jgi:hypothetical protein